MLPKQYMCCMFSHVNALRVKHSNCLVQHHEAYLIGHTFPDLENHEHCSCETWRSLHQYGVCYEYYWQCDYTAVVFLL